MRALAILMLLGAAASAPAAAPDTAVEVALSSFRFTPATITLDHGRRYDLRLVNRSGGGHDFVARAFFAAAALDPADRDMVDKGAVEVPGGATIDVHLVAPAPGSYDVHCSHFMHALFGMKGRIVVR